MWNFNEGETEGEIRTCRDGFRFAIAYIYDTPESPVYESITQTYDASHAPMAVLFEEDLTLERQDPPVLIDMPDSSGDETAYYLSYFTRTWAPELEPGTLVGFKPFRNDEFSTVRWTTVQDCYLSGAEADSVALDIGGRRPYSNSGDLTGGDFVVTPGRWGVSAVNGEGTIPGTAGGDATIVIDIHRSRFMRFAIGRIEVSDPGAGVRRSGTFVGKLTGEDGTAVGRGILLGRGRDCTPIRFTVVDAHSTPQP